MKATGLYESSLQYLLDKQIVGRDASILVLCAGSLDKRTFEEVGFTNVTLSNLDRNLNAREFLPYGAVPRDAEDIAEESGSYDFCVVHEGLHHCASPHRAILEMYRVARIGILACEPYDSCLLRLLAKFRPERQYEVYSTVGKESYSGGGLRFCGIPNFICRFSKRDFVKVIETAHPYARHMYYTIKHFAFPWGRFKVLKNQGYQRFFESISWLLRLFEGVPFLANNIAVIVLKPDLGQELHPWLEWSEGKIRLNRDWVAAHYESGCRDSGAEEREVILSDIK